MTATLLAFLIKLPLALLVFLLIAYAGTVSRHIAGVLLTFPILNGIAIVASPQPVVVADAIYPLVIFNCVLFALVISFPDALPPVRALPRTLRLFARVTVWSVVWVAGAYLLTDFRAAIPGAGVLLAASAAFAVLFMMVYWTKTNVARMERSAMRGQSRISLRFIRATDFIAFWGSRIGAGRIAFFVLAYACLFWVSRTALDEKWVGMASALPLPGFFAVAALMDDAESGSSAQPLLPMRDTLFLGPVLVIPFNWAFAHTLVAAFPPDALVARYALLFALWAVAAFALVLLVPRLAGYLDRRS
jgi:hypothetical protein